MLFPVPSIRRQILLRVLRWRIRLRNFRFAEVAAEKRAEIVWHKQPLAVLLIYIFTAFLFYWELHIPAPGKAVAFLAVAAAVMSLSGEMGGKEKLAWVCLLFGFLDLESISIATERKASEIERSSARAQEAESFRGIGQGIEESIAEGQRQFTKTMQRSDTIVAGIGNSIKTQTGGDSFAYITFTPEPCLD
jgi:hypothetical protein